MKKQGESCSVSVPRKFRAMAISLGLCAFLASLACLLLVSCNGQQKAVPAPVGQWPADLLPVKFHPAPQHPPVELVKDGKSAATIAEMSNAAGAKELQKFIKEATGVELPIVKTVQAPAIVLGDCPEAAAQGLVGKDMPPEGFAIKTAPGFVFIVGNLVEEMNGTEWGVYEFLERFLNMRWYFPQPVRGGPETGLDIPKTDKLVIDPVWLEDAPVYRRRDFWPPVGNDKGTDGADCIYLGSIQRFHRSGNSWPIGVQCHSARWGKYPELVNNRPEVFQVGANGKPQTQALCYSNPKTLETYLEGIQAYLDKKEPVYAPISKNRAISVSPEDLDLDCHCTECRKLWDEKAAPWGSASKVLATFVDKLGREVKKRWPKEGFTIIFLPYANYTTAPEGFKFPDNVEVQICGMPGMANLKDAKIRENEYGNIDKWSKISGRKVQTWVYSCWPADRSKAPYQYPHVLQDFYQRNRDKIVGSLVNGEYNHWPRQNITLYCWQKLLWNPDYNVDAAMDEFCRRMFGPAAKTMRELLALQTDCWEKSVWPDGQYSAKNAYEISFNPEAVEKIKELVEEARDEAKSDPLVAGRIEYYYNGGLKNFFPEAEVVCGKVKDFSADWTITQCSSDMNPGLRHEHCGRKNVLSTHPFDRNTPCILYRELSVPSKKKTTLRLAVSHHRVNDWERGDWILIVKADGKELFNKLVGKDTVGADGWMDVSVDLSQFAGKKVKVELFNQPNGWAWEAAYWGKIDVVSE